MLRTEDNGANAAGLPFVTIFNSHLAFRIGAKPRNLAALPDLLKLPHDSMGEHNRGWHQLRRFIASEAEHHALVASALLSFVNAERDIRALLADEVGYVDAFGIEDWVILSRAVADTADYGFHNPLVVQLSLGGNFPGKDTFTRVSQPTRLSGSCARPASRMASEIASATLSGWPQPIDSDVMDLKKERE